MFQRTSFSRLAGAGVIMVILACSGCGDPIAPRQVSAKRALAPLARTSAGKAQLSPADQQLLGAIRAATARFQNVDAARAAGYVDDGFGCVSDPVLGGMGWHLINDPLHADPNTDPLRPDLLVYEPQRDGSLKLVALEYEVYQQDWFGAGHTEPPTLLGQEFEAIDFPPLPLIFGLHLWLWRENPTGLFADFNPKVTCP